jgi:phage/plasmid-associated DNA primase
MVKLGNTRTLPKHEDGKPLMLDYPRDVARAYLSTLPGRALTYQETVYVYSGNQYKLTKMDAVKASIESWLEGQSIIDRKGNLSRYPVHSDNTGRVIDQFKSITHHSIVRAPTWIEEQEGDPNPAECVVLEDGILHIPTRRLVPSTDRFFSPGCLPIKWGNGEPSSCNTWLEFLASDWGPDSAQMLLLQEWFGLCLSWQTKYQKFLMLSGPPRCGKGTIIRMAQSLAGDNGYEASLAMFSRPAMDEEIAAAQIITIPDARKSANTSAALEMLLMITGEDSVNFNRKYKGNYRGQVLGRIMIASNGLALFSDTSEALATRALHLARAHSHEGDEDYELQARLKQEIRGVFFWALDGFTRLNNRGRFDAKMQSPEAASVFRGIVNPIGRFIAQGLVFDPKEKVSFHALYNAWKQWKTDCGVLVTPRREELVHQIITQERGLRADFEMGILHGVMINGEVIR